MNLIHLTRGLMYNGRIPFAREVNVKNPLLNIGYGNFVVAERVVAIATPTSAPMKRLKEDAKENGKLLNATQGRRTRSMIIMDSDHVVLSAVQAETVANRFGVNDKKVGSEDGAP